MKQVLNLSSQMHSLNSSPSKQKFSFSKADRFSTGRKSLCDSYYEVPTTKTRRTTSFGYGLKNMGLNFDKNIPPPNTYTLDSQFQLDNKPKKGFSFGYGRQQMKIGGPLVQSVRHQFIPGPGQYHKEMSTFQAPTCTMKSRLPDLTQKHLLKIPGPGTYKHQQIGTNNYYVTSKHPNNNHTKISPERKLQPISRTINLGPGQCTSLCQVDNLDATNIQPTGRYALSKNQNSQARLFNRSQRAKLINYHMLNTPPPNYYNQFSTFG